MKPVHPVLAILAVALSLLGVAPAPAATRPNIVFILADDLGYGDVRCLNPRGKIPTPHLDRLAAEGMVFTDAHSSSAVCPPTRYGILTGRYNWRSRLQQGVQGGLSPPLIEPGRLTVPAFLQRLGYHTFLYLALHANGQTLHSSVRIADAAIDYLRTNAARSPNPFFMYVAFNAPHDPRQSPRAFLDLYPPSKLKLPPNCLPQHPFPIEANFDGRDEILAPYPRTPEVIRVHLQEYYSIITHLDAQIGRILEALDLSGKAGNTIVIFTSDQGLAVGQHGLLGKQNLYDHSLRMPFLIAGPGIPKGKRHEALFYMQSLYATTCEMAGVPAPETVQFPSLVPLITGAKKQLHDALYAAFLDRQRAVRTTRWKLIRTPTAQQVQLFDISQDPWEMRNLAGQPKYATTLRRLDAKLRELMQELKDPLPPEKLFGPKLTNGRWIWEGKPINPAELER